MFYIINESSADYFCLLNFTNDVIKCLVLSKNPKNIQFIIISDTEKLQTFTFENLQPANI